MKIKIALALILFANTTLLFSQDLQDWVIDEGKIKFEKITEVENTKEQMYLNSKQWFAKAFKSAQNVIQYDSKEDGKVISKGNTDIYIDGLKVLMHFTITITVKENKYRVLFEQIEYQGYPNQLDPNPAKISAEAFYLKDPNFRKKLKEKYKASTISEVNTMLKSIGKSMEAKENKEDW